MYAKMTKSLGTGREDSDPRFGWLAKEVKGLQFEFEAKPEGFSARILVSEEHTSYTIIHPIN